MLKLLPIALALVVVPCAQALNMKAGLWEVSTTMKSSDPEMEKAMREAQEAMKNLPPEQRRMMEEMMAKQGVSVSQDAGGAIKAKVCFTQAMIDKSELPIQQQGDCKTQHQAKDASTYTFTVSCSKPKTDGKGVYVMTSDSSYRYESTVVTEQSGKPVTMTMNGEGNWLGEDCGNIKPLG